MGIEDGDFSGFANLVGTKNAKEVIKLMNKSKEPHWFWRWMMAVSLMAMCGTTVKYLWNWYIASLGIRTITFYHALGIDMLLTFIFT